MVCSIEGFKKINTIYLVETLYNLMGFKSEFFIFISYIMAWYIVIYSRFFLKNLTASYNLIIL